MVTTTAVRYPAASVVATGLMAALFLTLFTVISQRPAMLAAPEIRKVDFTPKIKPTQREDVGRVKPKQVVLTPTPPIPGPTTGGPAIGTFVVPPQIVTGPPTVFRGRVDSSEQPLVRPEAEYPRSARARGIEGWVELQFTVTGAGTVTDVAVVDADPKGVFDAAASKAVQSWKYAPRVEDGRAIERRGNRVVLRFDLN